MAVIFAKAPGKIILFGEHAVVYGQPAIAIPVNKVTATARVIPNMDIGRGDVQIQAPDIQLDSPLSELPSDHPLAAAVRLVQNAAEVDTLPGITLQISSTIPIAAGMGSSAATSIAVIRALSDFLGASLSADQVSTLAYQLETIQHGTPSGIDNNVISHEKPVYFIRDEPVRHLEINAPSYWVVADSGEKTPTRETVADVRGLYDSDPQRYGELFNQIGTITQNGRESLINGDLDKLGNLMIANQTLLDQINLNSPVLEHLISAAIEAGAKGAKLSGGGRGGNIIALATADSIDHIGTALLNAGAKHIITTILNKVG